MHVACLCPTYGRPSLAANALWLFLAQQLRSQDTADLIIFDDAGQLVPTLWARDDQRGTALQKRWFVHATRQWQPLPTKYPAMSRYLDTCVTRTPDAYVIWDDDDVYLPWHLAAHATALEAAGPIAWSHPATVLSTHGTTVVDQPRAEPAAGRLWGSAAVTAECLAIAGGWCQDDRADYDQQNLARWSAVGAKADPCQFFPPSYIYRWADTGRHHVSGDIQGNRYRRPPIQEAVVDVHLQPRLDPAAAALLARLQPPLGV